MERDLEVLLVKSHIRVTTPRKAVFRTLKTAVKPQSHMDIAKANAGINKTSVYRTIELFMKLGVVVGVSHGWKQRYELAAPFRPHHHHLLCINCGNVVELQSEKLERTIHDIASTNNFQVIGHTFEITGLCNSCRRV